MKHEKLSQALNEISSEHIAEASDHKRKVPTAWMGALAAVLALVILLSSLGGPASNIPAVDSPAADAPAADSPADAPAVDAPAADAPATDAPVLEGLDLLNAHFAAAPSYPAMTKFDGYDWGLYFQSHRAQYDQPEGYANGSETFFRGSIPQMLNAETDNQVYSPLNVYMALAMLAETTDGESRQQLLTLLGADSIEALRTQAGHMWNAHYCDDGISVSVLGNSLWLDDAYSFADDTIGTLSGNYYASVYRGDLGSDETNDVLHQWINLHTGGLLQEQAESFNLQPDSVMGLVSTIYYNTCWNTEFYEGNHTENPFHTPTGEVSTTFMNQTLSSSTYYWGADFSAVPIGLMDGGKMWLVLPNEGYTPADLVASGYALDLVLGDSGSWENQSNPLIHLSVPKFDVVAETDLITPLQVLGVTDIFDSSRADFSFLISEKDQPYLAQMLHAARVTIDEQGITGAAFTAADAAAAEAPEPEEEISFILDRPFLFIIESRDGIPVFCGIVNNP